MKLSVVIPAHNEEGCIESTVTALELKLREAGIEHEILVINDNSTDQTGQILERLKSRLPSLKTIDNIPPHGFGFAVRCGLDNFSGDVVAVYMADASDTPEDLVRYFQTLVGQGVD